MTRTIQIEKRNKEDMLRGMKKLAESYVPEWSFDTTKPDAAAAIALIFAREQGENAERINQVLDRYHTEFINLLDISVKPAIPAKAVVQMELLQDTVDGTYVPKGTRLLSNDTEGDNVVFEVQDNIYITSADVDSIYMTDGQEGRIIPLKGDIEVPALLDGAAAAAVAADIEETDAEEQEEETGAYDKTEGFTLFDEDRSIELNALRFFHPCLFAVKNNDIYVRFEGNEKFVRDIASGKYIFKYVNEGVLCSFKKTELMSDGKTLRLLKDDEGDLRDDGNYALFLVYPQVVKEDVFADSVSFSAAGGPIAAEFCGSNLTEYRPEGFAPFTEEFTTYQECFIGHDEYFRQAGSRVTLDFDLTFREKHVKLSAEQEEADLKIIKKIQKSYAAGAPANVFIQNISIEYFNGRGYKRLEMNSEAEVMFSEEKPGRISLSFICPKDWEPSQVGGYEGRCIRLQILRADNCFLRPAMFHYPYIENLGISFSYEGVYQLPEKMSAIYGTYERSLAREVISKQKLTLFKRSPYVKDALYLGLNKRPVNGPVSLVLRLKEDVRYDGPACLLEYSTRDGFKPLKAVDSTGGFSRSGTIMFLPPADFFNSSIEGNKRYWIRVIRDPMDKRTKEEMILPKILDVSLNGVEVLNVDTHPEKDYFLDEITPNARFNLGEYGIMDAQVWVNEMGVLPAQAMRELLDKDEDRVRAERDIQGNITAFYVKWQETERFEVSRDRRVYMLDRLTGQLIFGDGVNTDIPRCTDDVALKVSYRSSNGSRGNVEADSINTGLRSITYVGDMRNPDKACGGSDMESVQAAIDRGAALIAGRKRLVSARDYIREISFFSDTIDQVSMVTGVAPGGKKQEGCLTFLLLMKDFENGSASFHRIKDSLREHLLKHCSIMVSNENLYISEPVFVKISVSAWLRTEKMQEAFEMKKEIEQQLQDYLNPVSDSTGRGWGIGMLPTVSQIQMKINIFKKRAILSNVSITAEYMENGKKIEKDLSEMTVTPMMVCTSGVNDIHIDM